MHILDDDTASHPPDTLESEIRSVGNTLYRLSQRRGPVILTKSWLQEKIIHHCLENESFKVRLFQFIDVLPMLRTPAHVVRVAREYFSDASVPESIRSAIGMLPRNQVGTNVVAAFIRRQTRSFARQFIVSDTIPGSLQPLKRLWERGHAFSMDLLGEEAVSEHEADQYCQRYLDALTMLDTSVRTWRPKAILEHDQHGVLPRINISVKLSSLYSQLDPISPEGSVCGVAPRLRAILRSAQAIPASVTIDMETYQLKDLVLHIVQRLLMEDEFLPYPHAGIAIQAYLKDAEHDVRDMIHWVSRRGQPFHIRLVKGAYWDYERIIAAQRRWPVPVFEHKSETDANFEMLTTMLLDHADVIRPAIGSHNVRSIAHAAASARHRNLPSHAYEIQMLYGIANPLKHALRTLDVRLREYTPVGDLLQGMAYLIRRLLENTANESILHKPFGSVDDRDTLLLNPASLNGHHALHPANNGSTTHEFHNEPPTDFSQSRSRLAMQEALRSVRSHISESETAHALHDREMQWRCSLVSHSPARPCDVIGRMGMATRQDVDRAIHRAKTAQPAWASTAPKARAAVLFKAAEALRRRRFEFAAWDILEVGRSWRDADADVGEAIDFLEFYGREMIRIGDPKALGHYPGEWNRHQYRPRGLVAVLSPWNFPLAIPTGMVAAALVTGNAVLFKPSERSPVTGRNLAELLWSSGCPDQVLQLLPGGPDIGQHLVEHPDIHAIAFTGSKHVGLQIVEAAARLRQGRRDVKKVVAEMGGKNAIIVDDTADLDEAVRGVIKSAFEFQGQKCSACSRLILLSEIYEPFVSRIVEATRSLSIGPPDDPRHQIGPVIDERAFHSITEYIALGKHGAAPAMPQQPPYTHDDGGWYVRPEIFLDVRPEDRIAQEEVFGPVLAVFAAETFDAALQIANDTEYGLTAGLFSRSPGNIERAQAVLEVGNLYINRGITGALVGPQPFGGFHLSGCGAKAGGPDYLKQFMVAQSVTVQTLRRGFAPPDNTALPDVRPPSRMARSSPETRQSVRAR